MVSKGLTGVGWTLFRSLRPSFRGAKRTRNLAPHVAFTPRTHPSYAAQAGYPVRRGLSAQSLRPLEYRITRPGAQLRTRRTMTTKHTSAFPRRIPPGLCNSFRPKRRGRRECRVLAAPAVSCAIDAQRCAHEHTGAAGAFRHSLHNGFTAYAALSSETNSSCLRHRRIDGVGAPGRARNTSADLTPATGARTTRFCRTQHACAKGLDGFGTRPPKL